MEFCDCNDGLKYVSVNALIANVRFSFAED